LIYLGSQTAVAKTLHICFPCESDLEKNQSGNRIERLVFEAYVGLLKRLLEIDLGGLQKTNPRLVFFSILETYFVAYKAFHM